VEGLYLVGAGTHPGAGLPGVISSAKVTSDLIKKHHNGITSTKKRNYNNFN
jgi:phytoene desaturase